MKTHWVRYLLGMMLLAGLVLVRAKTQAQPSNPPVPMIRVGISNDAMTAWEYPSVTFLCPTGCQVLQNGHPEFSIAPAGKVSFSADSSGLRVALEDNPEKTALEKTAFSSALMLVPTSSAPNSEGLVQVLSITRKGKNPLYRGLFEVSQAKNPKNVQVVNELALEDYLKAVVPNEMPDSFGLEAVKAQTLAARNYAISPRERPWDGFDICDSQYCQVYLGAQTETSLSKRAIAETSGQVLLYYGKPALTLFASNHGGYADSFSEIFAPITPGNLTHPYLRAKPDVPAAAESYGDLRQENNARRFWGSATTVGFDSLTPLARWQKKWTRAELEASLQEAMALGLLQPESSEKGWVIYQKQPEVQPKPGALLDIIALQRSQAGKLLAVKVLFQQPNKKAPLVYTAKGERVIRQVFSTLEQGKLKALPSANVVFTLARKRTGKLTENLPEIITAVGGGFGHGVGMSQYGAYYMAKQGKLYTDILAHYYPKTALSSVPLNLQSAESPLTVTQQFMAAKNNTGRLVLARLESSKLEGSEKASPVTLTVALNGNAPVSLRMSAAHTQVSVPVSLKPAELNTLRVLSLIKGSHATVSNTTTPNVTTLSFQTPEAEEPDSPDLLEWLRQWVGESTVIETRYVLWVEL